VHQKPLQFITSKFVQSNTWHCKIITIAHFRVVLYLFFKASPGAHPFMWKWPFIHMQIKLIFIWKVRHQASLWKGDTRQLGNGLLNKILVHKICTCTSNKAHKISPRTPEGNVPITKMLDIFKNFFEHDPFKSFNLQLFHWNPEAQCSSIRNLIYHRIKFENVQYFKLWMISSNILGPLC